VAVVELNADLGPLDAALNQAAARLKGWAGKIARTGVGVAGVGLSIAGPILGALLLEPLHQYLASNFADWYLVIYGGLLLAVLLLLPRGILPTLQERWAKYRASREQTRETDAASITPLPEQEESAVKTEGINL